MASLSAIGALRARADFPYNIDEPVYWTPIGSAEIALDKKQPLNGALNLSLLLREDGV